MADTSWIAIVVAVLSSGVAVEFTRRRFPSRDREADSIDKRRDAEEARYQRFNEATDRFRDELRQEMDALRIRHEECEMHLRKALDEHAFLVKEQGVLFVQVHKVEAALEALKEKEKNKNGKGPLD